MELTRRQFEELARVQQSPFEFAKHIYVVHPVRGRVRFDLYPFQRKVLYEFLTNRFSIVLKSRQMGLTEVIALFVLWVAMYTDYQNIQMISLKDRVAKRLLRRIKFMYRNLPEHLRVPVINGRKTEFGTDSEMLFSNGSSIVSVPTTQDAVRSEPVSVLVMDEAAIMKYADTIWAAALPALSTGGRAIVNSTPYGSAGFFYNTWKEALTGSNGFKPFKIPWNLHPERDMKWYMIMKRALGLKRTAQEIDCDFLASGDNVFDLADIRNIEERLADYPPIEKRLKGNLLIFEKPIPGEVCYIGADVSTGRAKDYSSFAIYNSFGVEKACFKGKIPVNKFRDLLFSMGEEYNWALIAVDAIGVGEAVTSGLQELNYPNLYYTIQIVKETRSSEPIQKKVPGFFGGPNNRQIIINGLEQDVREESIEIRNPFFVAEAYSFVYDDMNRPIAMSKGEYIGDGNETYTDDSIFAEAIANHIRKGKSISYITTTPK